MRCPHCGSDDTLCIDSRRPLDSPHGVSKAEYEELGLVICTDPNFDYVRRRRKCRTCNGRWTTNEINRTSQKQLIQLKLDNQLADQAELFNEVIQVLSRQTEQWPKTKSSLPPRRSVMNRRQQSGQLE